MEGLQNGEIRNQAVHIVVKIASAAARLSFRNGQVSSKYM